METTWLDLRFAVRALLKRPALFAVCVLTLGLCVGANVAIFSVVDAVLLRPLPFPHDEGIVRIIQNRPPGATQGMLAGRLPALSTDDLQAWRSKTTTLAAMGAYGPVSLTLTGGDEPVRLTGARVSPALFRVLGVAPFKGRTFLDTEESPGADAAVVLSFTAWQRYFAADPDILSKTIRFDDRGYTVVGIMPQGFEFPTPETDAWVPFVLTPPVPTAGQRMIQLVQVIARVKDGVSIATATAEANVIFSQLREEESRSSGPLPDDGPPAGAGPAGRGEPNVVQRGGPGRADVVERGGPGSAEVARRGGGPGNADVVQRGGRGDGPGFVTGLPPATIELSRLRDEIVRPVRPALQVLLVSVGFVLLIACANVANLLLARSTARQQEVALRAALGAGRGRLLRQMLTESLVLAAIGTALGALLAWGGVQVLRAFGPADIPRLDEVGLDLPLFFYTLALAFATGVLFGIAPALRQSRVSEAQVLRQGSSTSTSSLRLFGANATRSLLAMAEIALAVVLLIGAGLLIRSFVRLSNVDPGYDPRHVLAFQVSLPDARYGQPQREAFYGSVLEELSAMPDARAAAVSNTLPLQPGIVRVGVQLVGRPAPARIEEVTGADVRVISPDYLTAMGIRLADGRALSADARADQPREVLVNETFVRRYLPDERAVGMQMTIDDGDPWTIVGVVGDVRYAGLTTEPSPELYVDYRQVQTVMPRGLRNAFFTVRADRDPLALVPGVRALVRRLDGQLVVDNVGTMEQRLSASVAGPRFYAVLAGIFAAVAVVLAGIGIYGVLAYTVSQSTRELGIRIALGASAGGVLGLVLRQGGAIAIAGLAIGLTGAAWLTRSLSTLLFGVAPLDPATFAGVAALVTTVALAACLVPARRAASVDPIVALRQE